MSLSHGIAEEFINTSLSVSTNEPMSRHTSFQIGGTADIFISATSTDDIKKALRLSKKLGLPYHIIGNGTNILVSDSGIRGVVIQIKNGISDIKVENDMIYAGAGALLSSVASAATKHSLSGFERLGGIPGSIGGAVFMNAGAYEAQIGDILVSSSYIDSNGECGIYNADEHCFGYRKSIYTDTDKIITGAVFKLKSAPLEQIKAEASEYAKRRRDKQPLTFPSAGSVFKRPEGHFAAALIEQAGLKGFCIGGACVSEKHAGFIINTGGATARDVIDLILHIKQTVYEKSSITLECEIKMLGDF